MSKEIMTFKQWVRSLSEDERNELGRDLDRFAGDYYARYYAHALIDSLTDEEIEAEHNVKRDGLYDDRGIIGAKWAREELKKRIK